MPAPYKDRVQSEQHFPFVLFRIFGTSPSRVVDKKFVVCKTTRARLEDDHHRRER